MSLGLVLVLGSFGNALLAGVRALGTSRRSLAARLTEVSLCLRDRRRCPCRGSRIHLGWSSRVPWDWWCGGPICAVVSGTTWRRG